MEGTGGETRQRSKRGRAGGQVDEDRESVDTRSTREVFDDHLRLRARGDLEADVERNYSPDLVLMHVNGVERGHAGIRKSGRRLIEQLPQMEFEVLSRQIEGRYAYLEWRARSSENMVRDGADSFVVEGGRIVFQSIHYTLEPAGE